MVHLLSSRNRSEFLAVPELVRFTMSIGASGPAPELLVKASSLHLKYLLRLGAARILFLRIASSWLDYGVEIPDDEKHPAVIWSLLEHDDELTALRELLQRPRCMVHLFNDIAVNVAWTEIDLNLSQQNAIDLIESTALHPTNETNAVDEVKERLDAVHGGQPTSFLSFIVSIPTPIEHAYPFSSGRHLI